MSEQAMVPPYNRILLNNKRNGLLAHGTTWMNHQSNMLSVKIQIQKAVYYMTFQLYNILEKASNIKVISSCQWSEVRGGDYKGVQGNFFE